MRRSLPHLPVTDQIDEHGNRDRHHRPRTIPGQKLSRPPPPTSTQDPVNGHEESVLEDYQRRVNALIRIPPNAFTIEDYPPEKRDG
jgi:hypothetical protein